jgi:ferritin-like metal-binding protein YciE
MATKVTTLDELFLDEIRDLYDAEKQLVKALPKMAKAASSDGLRQAFTSHLQETEGHVGRLEQIFEELGQKARGKKCTAMAGLISEGEELIGDTEESPVRDAGLIAAAQKVEHYEMAGYGSARTHAELLEHADAARLLQMTLGEEKAADNKLNQLAKATINEEAASTGSSGGNSAPKTRSAGSVGLE